MREWCNYVRKHLQYPRDTVGSHKIDNCLTFLIAGEYMGVLVLKAFSSMETGVNPLNDEWPTVIILLLWYLSHRSTINSNTSIAKMSSVSKKLHFFTKLQSPFHFPTQDTGSNQFHPCSVLPYPAVNGSLLLVSLAYQPGILESYQLQSIYPYRTLSGAIILPSHKSLIKISPIQFYRIRTTLVLMVPRS